MGEGTRGGKVARLSHGKLPGARQRIVHKSTESLPHEPLAKLHPAGLIFSRLEAKAEDAGGHFWHDMVIETNIITPAK